MLFNHNNNNNNNIIIIIIITTTLEIMFASLIFFFALFAQQQRKNSDCKLLDLRATMHDAWWCIGEFDEMHACMHGWIGEWIYGRRWIDRTVG